MGGVPYSEMTPAMRAQDDFRRGQGLDTNPYNRETQRKEYDDYQWHMHTLQAREFAAEQGLGKSSVPETDEDAARRSEQPAAPTSPPF